MVKISKNEFFAMMSMRILTGHIKGFKNFSVTSRNKKSKRKRYYVSEQDYLDYKRTIK